MIQGGVKGQGTSRFIAFLDECGDHSMTKIDSDFPIFVLSCVVMERTAYISEVIPQVSQFKLRYWDHEGVNLHSREIRKAEGPFSILQDAALRAKFMVDISSLVGRIPFTLFIVAINKQKHHARYSERAKNPYDLALDFAFERVLHFMESNGETHLPVIAEARGKNEDAELSASFSKLLETGTYYSVASRFNNLTCPLLFARKERNIVGTQVADLCAYPSARHALKPSQPNAAFDVVEKHLYDSGAKGWKSFP